MADTKVLVAMELPLRVCSVVGCRWSGVILTNTTNAEVDYYLTFEPINPPGPMNYCPFCGGRLIDRE